MEVRRGGLLGVVASKGINPNPESGPRPFLGSAR